VIVFQIPANLEKKMIVGGNEESQEIIDLGTDVGNIFSWKIRYAANKINRAARRNWVEESRPWLSCGKIWNASFDFSTAIFSLKQCVPRKRKEEEEEEEDQEMKELNQLKIKVGENIYSYKFLDSFSARLFDNVDKMTKAISDDDCGSLHFQFILANN
jgi:hypothetical protein